MAASSSTEHMWLFEDGQLNRLSERPQWIAESVNVFTGNFTCASDKEKLVDVMMALYSFTIACGRYNSEKEAKPTKATSRYQVSPIEEVGKAAVRVDWPLSVMVTRGQYLSRSVSGTTPVRLV